MSNRIDRVKTNTHVVLPGKLVESDGVDVLVEDEGKRDGKVEDVEALGAEGEGQDLNGVRDDKWREGKTKETVRRM
jgi:hypothetical protein